MDNLKKRFRQKALSTIYSKSLKYYEDASDLICSNIINLKEFKQAKYIVAYIPIPFEPDILPIIDIALELKKKVFFPCLNQDFLIFKQFNGEFKINKFGIPEPTSNVELPLSKRKKLFLIPGIAFDINKNRLGRGKGFYDKTLDLISQDPYSKFLGIAYSCQVYKKIPHTKKDIPMHLIITEEEIID